jgi:hypothetical protein
LELNSVLISLERITRLYPLLYLSEWRHDLEMQHHKSVLPPLLGKKRFLVPDAFVQFILSPIKHLSFLIELDRGTVNTVYRFRERIRDYCDFVTSGAYQRDFGSNSLTILWVTTAGDRRVEQLRKWTKAELTDSQNQAHMKFHRFLAVPPLFSGCLRPEAFLFSPVWLTLEHDMPVALIKHT